MPFERGNKLGSHNNHPKGRPCYSLHKIVGSRWMQKDGVTKRVLEADFATYLAEGWSFGRPQMSEESRKRISEGGKRAVNPGRFKSGHKTWNIGDKMPEYARLNMSAAYLAKYGVTKDQIREAWANEMSWCSEHKKFEPNSSFTILSSGKRSTRCQKSHKKYSPWFLEQFEKQGGVCALCGKPETNGKALCVDHSHECENPLHTRKHEPLLGCTCSRGLVCGQCNFRIEEIERFMSQGSFIPKPGSWAEKAIEYLSRYAAVSV